MTTVQDIVSRAYRHLGVSSADTLLEADEVAEGVAVLNDMLFAWELDSVDLELTADLSSADTFPLDRKFDEGTSFLLASRLRHAYMVPASFDPDEFMNRIRNAYLVIPTPAHDGAITNLPSQLNRLTSA